MDRVSSFTSCNSSFRSFRKVDLASSKVDPDSCISSFRSYGKVDPVDDADFKRKSRKRVIILSVSFVLLAVIISAIVGTVVHKNKNSNSGGSPVTSRVKSVCSVTQYPESCVSSLKNSNSSDPVEIFQYSLTVAVNSLEKIASFPNEFVNRTSDERVKEALGICNTVINDAIESLHDSIEVSSNRDEKSLSDLKTWLSTVVTDLETCFDSLTEVNTIATLVDEIRVLTQNSTVFASNSLNIASKVLGFFEIPYHRRLLGFPAEAAENLRPDLTVAADGSGDVRTLKEMVEKIPKKSMKRFVVYVKKGVYVENVVLEKNHWNVMIYGDGASATIFSGRKNFVDGTGTFNTATFAVSGKGFIARDIGFINTAGPEKAQAVAFRSSSDQSVFYRCSFDAYQDTLYAYANRQFYRECNITGTVDFIFGRSAAVFQNCNILPRQPMPGQFVTITAQGKNESAQHSGISIQRCVIKPLDDLKAATYLGRPWKNYSTTVVMETYIGGFLSPLGWAEWQPGVIPPKTIFYAEYKNIGPGSSTVGRVNWTGYWPSLTVEQASKYNVKSFIEGSSWLPGTNVAFESE